MTTAVPPKAGLEDVVAASSAICYLDGARGVLAYRGYDINDLATQATFEEVCYLLWHGRLPTSAELGGLQSELAAARPLPEGILRLMRTLPPDNAMDTMRTLVSALSHYDPLSKDESPEGRYRTSVRLTAQLASVVATSARLSAGGGIIAPDPVLGHAANFLYMLTGQHPSEVNARAFDASLVLYAEHEMNASTFTTRVISSTLSDMHSAVAGGVGALKGPLHGGAGEAVMLTLQEIGRMEEVGPFVERTLAARRRLMGFGHRVYRAGDPRATILRRLAEEACRLSGQGLWFEMAVKLHEHVNAAKGLIPNVDFYSAPLFYALGIPVDLFTPVIAASRIAGWTSHVLEQHADNRLIRPRGAYNGPGRRAFIPLAKRESRPGPE